MAIKFFRALTGFQNLSGLTRDCKTNGNQVFGKNESRKFPSNSTEQKIIIRQSQKRK